MIKELLNITIIHDLRTQLYHQHIVSDVVRIAIALLALLICAEVGITALAEGQKGFAIFEFVLVGVNILNGVNTVIGMIKRRREYKEEVSDFEKCRDNLIEMMKTENEDVI